MAAWGLEGFESEVDEGTAADGSGEEADDGIESEVVEGTAAKGVDEEDTAEESEEEDATEESEEEVDEFGNSPDSMLPGAGMAPPSPDVYICSAAERVAR